MSKLYTQNTVDTEEKSKILVDILIEKHGFDLNSGQCRIIEQEVQKLLEDYTLEIYENLF